MVKHGPIERRTRAEMVKGKAAAKKADKRWKAFLKKAKSSNGKHRDQLAHLSNLPEELTPYTPPPIDPNVELPRSVRAQIDVANAFYENGRFYAFVKQLREVEDRLLTIAPTLKLALPGERREIMHAFGGLVQNFATAMRYMEP